MPLANSDFKKIQRIVGKDYCSRKKEDLVCYGYDATGQTCLPEAVVFPGSSQEISEIFTIAGAADIPVTPRGAGSGLSGGAVCVNGGLVLVMTRFNRMIHIDGENLTADVEPGVVVGHFHAAVEKKGLFYPPDPASSDFSTLGGNLAECAGGPRAVKYGVTRDYVLGLEAVIPTGEMINTGVRTAKGVVGYDLTRLLVGSEGTLAVITRMTLRLLPLPESVRTMTAVFDDMETAAEAVSGIIKHGILPRTIEYMDQTSIRCVNTYMQSELPVDAGALLLLEVDGMKSDVDAALGRLTVVCRNAGAVETRIAGTRTDVSRLWAARKSINPALFQYAPHKINEDIVVPRNKIPDMVRKIIALKNKTGLTIASYGHAGDGNIHVNIMLDKRDATALKKADAAIEELFDYTLAVGGSISGEHGVGTTKSAFIHKEIGPTELMLMKRIKSVFDPKGILNPGKMFQGQ
ncbi:MAG: FAD-linked oxidase C-terminal domain-containing protein [Desulfobacterales bacterium]